jgi:hypothetical protein
MSLTRRERWLLWWFVRTVSISVGVAIGAAMATGAEVERKPTKPTLTIKLHPSGGFMPLGGGPFRVNATVLLLDPDKTLECPGYVVFWRGVEDKTVWAPETCPTGVAEREVRYRWTMEHTYYWPMDGEVEVAVVDVGPPEGQGAQLRATTRLWIMAHCERVADEVLCS